VSSRSCLLIRAISLRAQRISRYIHVLSLTHVHSKVLWSKIISGDIWRNWSPSCRRGMIWWHSSMLIRPRLDRMTQNSACTRKNKKCLKWEVIPCAHIRPEWRDLCVMWLWPWPIPLRTLVTVNTIRWEIRYICVLISAHGLLNHPVLCRHYTAWHSVLEAHINSFIICFFISFYFVHQIKDGEMSGAYGKNEKCVQNFGR
jgi:hypothetical protein